MLAVEWLERAEHDAWEDLYRACPAEVASGLGLGVGRMDGALYLQARAIPLTQFNRLSGLGLAADESAIDRALGRFREPASRKPGARLRRACFRRAPRRISPGRACACMSAAGSSSGDRPSRRRASRRR